MHTTPYSFSYIAYDIEARQNQQQARTYHCSSHSPFTLFRGDTFIYDTTSTLNFNNLMIGTSTSPLFSSQASEFSEHGEPPDIREEDLPDIKEKRNNGKQRDKHSLDFKRQVILARLTTKETMTQLSRRFNVKRSTIYGFLKNQKLVDQIVNVIPTESIHERCRLPKVGTGILDELVVSWIRVLISQGYAELHRQAAMEVGKDVQVALQGILLNKQCPRKFSGTWINKIIERCNNEPADIGQSIGGSLEEHIIRWFIRGYEQDEIYYCGLFGVFVTDIPNIYHSTLLFSNSTGLVKLAKNVEVGPSATSPQFNPRITLLGVDQRDFGPIGQHQKETFVDILVKWNEDIKRNSSRPILVIIDVETYSLMEKDDISKLSPLKHLNAIALPSRYIQMLPIGSDIQSVLRQKYKSIRDHQCNQDIAPVDIIQKAWDEIPSHNFHTMSTRFNARVMGTSYQ